MGSTIVGDIYEIPDDMWLNLDDLEGYGQSYNGFVFKRIRQSSNIGRFSRSRSLYSLRRIDETV